VSRTPYSQPNVTNLTHIIRSGNVSRQKCRLNASTGSVSRAKYSYFYC